MVFKPPVRVLRPHSSSDRVINFVCFVSRDGLMAQQPFGKTQSELTNKAFRLLKSSLVGVGRDERAMPAESDPDFRQRTREYTFEQVDVQPETGITTAIYVESMT